MSGNNPFTQDRDVLAAEYVLGLLEPAAMEAVAREAARDPAFADLITEWSERLEPLSALVPAVAPSDLLWSRIARDLPRRARPSRLAVWRAAAFAGFGVAACLAGVLLLSGHHLAVRIAWDLPPPPPPPVPMPVQAAPSAQPPRTVAPAAKPVVQPPPAPAAPLHPPGAVAVALLDAPGREQPAMKAVITRPGSIRLIALQVVLVPPGKALDVWVWPRDEAAPIRLGRIGADGGVLPFPYVAQDGTPMMVTEENAGLPATDSRGPTLFQGAIGVLN
jgi:anti-sigma-K factor RskA